MADAVVIGAGPAGSSAAIRLARMGMRVRLYEKATFPRAKLCGGFMSPECLEDLSDLDVLDDLRAAGATLVRRTVIASMKGIRVESALREAALSTSRDILDQLLLAQAARAGVDIRMGADGFQDSSPRDFTVIAAGRALGARAQKLTPWYAGSQTAYVGVQAFFDNVRDLTDQVEINLVECGYVGLVRQQQGINVCAMVTPDVLRRHGPSLDNVLQKWTLENPILKDHFQAARRKSPWMSVSPVRLGIRQLSAPGTFYVGDAACVFDPFAGEGMAMGIYGSRLLMKAFEQMEMSAEMAYEILWRQAFLPALKWNAVMRLFYSVPFLRESILRTMQGYPQGLNWMTDLTRYRPAL